MHITIIKLRVCAAAFLVSLPIVAQCQSKCPVEILAVEPRATSIMSSSALMVSYRNSSELSIDAITFNVAFGTRQKPTQLTARHSTLPGEIDTERWGDDQWLPYLSKTESVTVWPKIILFAGGSLWASRMLTSGEMLGCVHRNTDAENSEPTSVKASELDQKQRSATRSIAPLAPKASSAAAEEKMQMIESGNASLCTISSTPTGASVFIDGNLLGVTPTSIVLRKTSLPRNVFISKSGYTLYSHNVVPNGRTIPIVAILKPLR